MQLRSHERWWVIVATTLSILWSADVRAQAAGHDLPVGFRSLAGVTLNVDSAESIVKKLGRTRERRIGEDHDAYVSSCYVPAGRSTHSLLELMSDVSDRGTPGRALNVIRVRSDASAAERDGCAELPPQASLSTPGGLRLDLRRAQVEGLLGEARRRSRDSLVYYFDAKEFLRADNPVFEGWNTPERRETCFEAGLPYASVAAMVTVVLRDDRVVEFRIERYDQSIC